MGRQLNFSPKHEIPPLQNSLRQSEAKVFPILMYTSIESAMLPYISMRRENVHF
jgi:hypothetical protein